MSQVLKRSMEDADSPIRGKTSKIDPNESFVKLVQEYFSTNTFLRDRIL